jgi:hypothetical protein
VLVSLLDVGVNFAAAQTRLDAAYRAIRTPEPTAGTSERREQAASEASSPWFSEGCN